MAQNEQGTGGCGSEEQRRDGPGPIRWRKLKRSKRSCHARLGLFLLLRFLDFGPGVTQGHGAVKDRAARRRVSRIHTEIALTFKLKAAAGFGLGQARLDFAVGQDFERMRIQIVGESLPVLNVVRVGLGEKMIVQPDLVP